MPILTLEAINENPCAVLSHALPEYPSLVLLLAAQIAATCLRQIAAEEIDENYRLYSNDKLDRLTAHHRAIDQWHFAHQKIGQIIYLLDMLYSVPRFDFWFERKEPK